jgi:hypothetical protein
MKILGVKRDWCFKGVEDEKNNIFFGKLCEALAFLPITAFKQELKTQNFTNKSVLVKSLNAKKSTVSE